MRKWSIRAFPTYPGAYIWVSNGEPPDSAMRAEGAKQIRLELQRLSIEPSPDRALESTVSRDRLLRRRLTAHALASLAMVMLADGHSAAARDTLDVAIARAAGLCRFWYLYLDRATVDIALGDTIAAAKDSAAAKSQPVCDKDWDKP